MTVKPLFVFSLLFALIAQGLVIFGMNRLLMDAHVRADQLRGMVRAGMAKEQMLLMSLQKVADEPGTKRVCFESPCGWQGRCAVEVPCDE